MDEFDVSFVCPQCGAPVSYSQITFTNGSVIMGLDWYCAKCGLKTVDNIVGKRGRKYYGDNDTQHNLGAASVDRT